VVRALGPVGSLLSQQNDPCHKNEENNGDNTIHREERGVQLAEIIGWAPIIPLLEKRDT
jgi:hypothetical protein